jgi:hypothetical protein
MADPVANVPTLPTQKASEHLERRARKWAHQQWARTASDIARATLDVVHDTGRFPRAYYVQHPDLLFKHSDTIVTIIQRKTYETLGKIVWNTCENT